MIKLMDTECIFEWMAKNMRVNGKMRSNTDWGKRLGLMVVFMKDYISMVKSIVKVFTPGMMDLDMMVSGLKIK
jgi:hypothetical protein